MKSTSLVYAALAAALLVVAPAMPAHAQFFETFVASNGSDASLCDSPATACRHISRALLFSSSGGEITCVDSANYFESKVTITKTITIDCQHLGDLPALVVNAAGIVVTLKNFSQLLDAVAGIEFDQGAALIVEGAHFRSNPVGIKFTPSTANAVLVVNNSLFENNQNAGIHVEPVGAGSANVVISGTSVVANGLGTGGSGISAFSSANNIHMDVRNSVISGNENVGILANASAGNNVAIIIDGCSIAHNGFVGIFATGASAFMEVTNSDIIGNNIGWTFSSGGNLLSYKNNRVSLNGTNGSPSGTISEQ
jgi:hypothetical protein